MSIVTKTGDDGKSRWQGKVVDKDSPLLEAVGELDELMAVVSIALKKTKLSKISDRINRDLYYISAYLAGYVPNFSIKESLGQIEADISRMEAELEPVDQFLRAGKMLNIWINWARVVARRTERRIVGLSKHQEVDKEVLKYFNRLSDYLFMLSRYK